MENNNAIENLNNINVDIYRTDEKGEINLIINKRGNINIKTHL